MSYGTIAAALPVETGINGERVTGVGPGVSDGNIVELLHQDVDQKEFSLFPSRDIDGFSTRLHVSHMRLILSPEIDAALPYSFGFGTSANPISSIKGFTLKVYREAKLGKSISEWDKDERLLPAISTNQDLYRYASNVQKLPINSSPPPTSEDLYIFTYSLAGLQLDESDAIVLVSPGSQQTPAAIQVRSMNALFSGMRLLPTGASGNFSSSS